MVKPENNVLAISEGRYNVNIVCVKCGSEWVKKDTDKEGLVKNTCTKCRYVWTKQGLDAYPVEKVGDLFIRFILEQDAILKEHASNKELITKHSLTSAVRIITGQEI